MKYVVALSSKLPMPIQLNALGHVGVGLAHLVPQEDQAMRKFRDMDTNFIGLMSDFPFIVLSARNSNHLRQAHRDAIDHLVVSNAFTIDMKDNSPEFQEATLANLRREDLEYVCLGLWGDDETLRPLTRRFSLFR